MRPLKAILALLPLLPAGCQSLVERAGGIPGPTTGPAPVLDVATTQPLSDPVLLTLDAIEPRPVLREPEPTTRAAGEAPLEALSLYAAARRAILDGRRGEAVDLLNRAIALDGASFELWYALGTAQAGSANGNEQALRAFLNAASLRADHLDLQLQLGRQYLTSHAPDADKAVHHLRLALQTRDYRQDESRAAMVNLLLARALQQKGCDTAALEQYQQVLRRLARPRHVIRGHPELLYLHTRQEVVLVQVGDLHQRVAERAESHARQQETLGRRWEELGRAEQAAAARAAGSELRKRALFHREGALSSFQIAAERVPDSLDHARRVVDAALALRREDDARRAATAMILRLHGSRESIALLADVLRRTHRPEELIGQLQQLVEQHPADRALLLALAESLAAAGRADEARRALRDVPMAQWDAAIVGRWVDIALGQDDAPGAARAIVEFSAHHSQSVTEMGELWDRLLAVSPQGRLGLAAAAKMDVPAEQVGAKLYWLAHLADRAGRDAASRTYLQQAIAQKPAFAPAFREVLADQLARAELTDAQKAEEGRKLIDLARLQKDDALAAELTAVLMLHEKKPEAAEAACLAAQKLGRRSPELLLDLASALLRAGQADGYERTMWKLLSDFPGFDAGYVSLYQHHLARASAASAVKVVNTWLQARPASIGARLLKAGLYMQVNQMADAERLLLACFRDQPHSARVVSGLRQYFAQCNRKADLIALLEQERRQRPHNRVVVGELVWLYVADGRTAQAQAALDAMRKAVESDGELLYYAAHLYERVDRKAVTEEVLSQVLKLDPAHPAANNDLGYLWADEGRNLDEAETLIRAATASEPDNAAFLDSLGWLQYKRGRFDQALRSLQQALVRSSLPDPVVLDHLGDTLYRLNQAGEAARTWQQSLQRLEAADPERLDLKLLKEQLVGKLKSHERGERVKVAPLGAQTRDNQAKG